VEGCASAFKHGRSDAAIAFVDRPSKDQQAALAESVTGRLNTDGNSFQRDMPAGQEVHDSDDVAAVGVRRKGIVSMQKKRRSRAIRFLKALCVEQTDGSDALGLALGLEAAELLDGSRQRTLPDK
jgi:hypothetical protein